MNADGTGKHRLSGPGKFPGICPDEYTPSWSPDGRFIAYYETGLLPGPGSGSRGINVMNADGTGRRHLCDCGDAGNPWDDGPSWSPDGTRVLFTALERGGGIDMINVDGSGRTRIINNGARGGRWSRDGERIVFTAGGSGPDAAGLSVIDRSGTVHRLTVPRPYVHTGATPPWMQVDAFPYWSPDGSRIVFSSNRDHLDDASGHVELFVINPDGTGLRKLTSKPCCASRAIDRPSW
jgi:Tol biopolymer transport system component